MDIRRDSSFDYSFSDHLHALTVLLVIVFIHGKVETICAIDLNIQKTRAE